MSYRDLRVYKTAYRLALEVHKDTMEFPKHETYELGSQLRKASKSVCLNIAEGYGRKRYEKDYAKFLVNALGSVDEVRVCLDFARDLTYLTAERHDYFEKEYQILGRQLNRFISELLASGQQLVATKLEGPLAQFGRAPDS